MDKFTEAEILSTCNALGSEVRGVYEKGTDCLECLRDLLQYIRKPDENHTVLRFLGSNHLIETDILPILKRYKDEKDIFDFALRLLVALTSPAILLFNEEIPADKASHNVYLELVGYLQNYKKVFFELDIWKVLYEHLERRITLRPIERSEEDNLFIERILIVIRNILHVPSDELAVNQTDDNLSPQDKILWNIHLSKVDTIILYLCANEDEYKYCLHTVEIISLMLREHTPETLASTSEVRSEAEKEKDAQDLMAVREREQNIKLKKVQSMISSRFNGVYRVKNFKSLSDNEYIAHKLIKDLDDLKFDTKKNAKRTPKNRLPFKEANITRRSTLNIRLFLKNFCKAFLKAYNKLMAAIKRELLRRGSADHDDTYYLWAIEYFMKFNRLYKFLPALVSETISLQMFHHIQTQITNYQEMMMTDKTKAKIWSRRMCLGVSAYRELLETVFTMTKSTDKNIQEIADNIVRNVFYVIEYREMLLALLYHFDEVKFSLTYLSELVESCYMFLKMLENHSKRHSEIIVQKKKRKNKKRKKTAAVSEQVDVNESLEDKWANIASNLSAAVQGRRDIPSDISPFDGASQLTFEEQKVNAVYQIREALLSKEVEQAVGLLRSARELWPEGDSFGGSEIDSEDEFDVLREIYLSNLENPQQQSSVPVEEEFEETDEEEESRASVVERKLDVKEIYDKFASPKVVMPCCLLLKNYRTNSSRTNTCLIKLIHKIAWDCKMYALFFQASVFVTFQKIFEDPDVSRNPIIKEFSRFAKFIISKFFETAEKNKKVFVEFLFWKGTKEAYEMVEGYGKPPPSSKKGAWTFDEEEELKQLYEDYKNTWIEGQDVGDIILAHLDDQSKTKNQIVLALKRLGLIQKAKDLKPHLRTDWTEDECNELSLLHEKYKDAPDMMEEILSRLNIKRKRGRVVDKLLELNLIQDRSETLKKKSTKMSNPFDDEPDDEDIMDSTDDSDLEDQGLYVKKSLQKKIKKLSKQKGSLRKIIVGDSTDSDADENFFKNLERERLENHDASNVDPVNSDDAQNEIVQKDKTPDVWQEQEIMELSDLFNKYQGTNDIMSKILNSLSVKRSKQSMTEKLLELGLIKDKKELRKKRMPKSSVLKAKSANGDISSEGEDASLSSISNSYNLLNSVKNKNKKVRQIMSDSSDDENQGNVFNTDENFLLSGAAKSDGKTKKKDVTTKNDSQEKRKTLKIWEEQEIVELQLLFKQHKDSNDIIGNIINDKMVKRSKENIIEKLLEIGLIHDRKEVRKKRTSKSNSAPVNKKTNKSNPFDVRPDDEDIMDSTDDSDLEDQGLSEKKNLKKKIKDLSEHKGSLQKNIIDDPTDSDADENFFKSLERERLENHDTSNVDPVNSDDAPNEIVQNKKTLDVWQEQEIMELSDLFNKYQDTNDVMSNILNSLTVKRSKQRITEKLLELGLIKDKKELRKKRVPKASVLKAKTANSGSISSEDEDALLSSISTYNLSNSVKNKNKVRQIMSDSSDDENQGNVFNTDENFPLIGAVNSDGKIKKKDVTTKNDSQEKRKTPKIWEEQEIVELQLLFEQHKDSNDIVGNIINDKTVKRSKENIVGKLLEVGLIHDRKEVRKKRTSKSNSASVNKKTNKSNSDLKLQKNKKKPRVNSSSSEDETLPLNSLLKANKKEHNGGIGNVKNKKAIDSESSDEETILRELQDYLNDGNSSGVPKEKKKALENTVDKNTMYNNILEKKKISRILSDSSDDETVSLYNNISNHSLHKENIFSQQTDNQLFKKSTNENSVSANGPTKIDDSSLKSIESHSKINNYLEDDKVIINLKRKRFQISDSDDSNEESLMKTNTKIAPLHSSNSKTVDLGVMDVGSDPVKETAQLPAVRKRARVLADSDESD